MGYSVTNPDEEDFRSRYGTETKGMPSDLAAIAARNLAAQDVSIAKVNAAGRLNPSPGVGAVGSTAQTDATNLATAAAMDRADLGSRFGFDSPQYAQGTETPTSPTLADTHENDILQRRQELAEKKQELMNTLGSTRIDDTKRRANLLANWHALDAEDKGLLHEHQLLAVDTAKTAHENLVRDLHIKSSNGLAKVINGIAGIEAPIGSDEHTVAALKILGDTTDPEIAAARGSAGFNKILAPYAEQAKKSRVTAESIKQAIDSYKSATGLEPGSVETTATGGINIRGKTGEEAKTIPASAYTELGKLNAQKASDSLYLARETDPELKIELQKKMDATDAAIGAWHQTYSVDKGNPVTPATVKMKSPDGTVKDVTPNQIEHYKKLGATLIQ